MVTVCIVRIITVLMVHKHSVYHRSIAQAGFTEGVPSELRRPYSPPFPAAIEALRVHVSHRCVVLPSCLPLVLGAASTCCRLPAAGVGAYSERINGAHCRTFPPAMSSKLKPSLTIIVGLVRTVCMMVS